MKPSERTFQFKKNYVSHHADGEPIQEIANRYGLSKAYAYRLIREIAEELGVPYEELIYQPHSTPILLGSGKAVEPMKPIDFSEFERDFRGSIRFMGEVIHKMDEALDDWPEEMPEDLKEV